MSYAAAYDGRDGASAERLLRRERHPLGVRRHLDYEPADDAVEDLAGTSKKWTFGVAAGALLVAGTFAAGALGLNAGPMPVGESAPEHAPAAPGNGPHGEGPSDIGTPAVAAPPHGDRDRPGTIERVADERGTAAGRQQAAQPGGNAGRGEGGEQVAPAPAPQPAPAPAPAPAPTRQPGPVEQVVTPVTDTVGDVTRPVTDTVGGILSPVTGALTGGDQPAMTMINPLGDLLGS